MNMVLATGCELTERGRGDLREAIRCIIAVSAAFASAAVAQQSVIHDDRPVTNDPGITVHGFMVSREPIVQSNFQFGIGGTTVWIDGIRQDEYPTPVGNTSSNQEQPDNTPVRNPQPVCSLLKDNPVDISNGAKHFSETDFESVSNPDLKLSRYKNPLWTGSGILGRHWITNFDVKISSHECNQSPGKPSCQISPSTGVILLQTAQGGLVEYQQSYPGVPVWTAPDGSHVGRIDDGGPDAGKYMLSLRSSMSSPRMKFRANGQIEAVYNGDGNNLEYTYDASNRLLRVRHASGRAVSFIWGGGTTSVVTSVIAPNGAAFGYQYVPDINSVALWKVNYPDGKGNVEYIGGSQIVEIKINGQSFKRYTYHDHSGLMGGRVATSSFADGSNLLRYYYYFDQYPDYLYATRTESFNAYGRKTTYILDSQRLVETIGAATVNCAGTASKATYRDDLLETTTSEGGIVTKYEYDSYRRKIREIKGLGTSQQRITTWDWDSDPNNVFRSELIKKVTVGGYSSVTYGYREGFPVTGLIASITEANLTSNGVSGASRTRTYDYTFHSNGLVAGILEDGPLPGAADYKRSSYNAAGDLISFENALGQIETYSLHNGFGQPGRVVSATGAVTEFEYDARGRVVVERRFPNGVAVEKMYSYGQSGLLDAITSTDGSEVLRHYDSARRLVQEDMREPGGGYSIRRFTYDAMSNPIKIEVGRDN